MADKSLIVGCYKHGYENYEQMRADPTLSFISSCPLPSQTQNNQTEQPKEDSNVDQDGEDGETSSVSKDTKDLDKFTRDASVDSPAISNKADTPVPETSGSASHEGIEGLLDDDKSWPSVVDLNTRLRRVISSYQRSVNKKDDSNKNFQKGGNKSNMEIEMTNPSGTTSDAPLNMQGWDLQQLAMYLLKMERREKMEAMVKERERTRIEEQKVKWSRREESEFLRVVSTYGVNYDRKKAQYDWTKFKSIARFDKKTDAELTDYYMSFRTMCKRVCNMKISEDDDVALDTLSPNKARQILDRVDLLSKIREEILSHPHLEERLSLCQPSGDTPDWWIPGKHDKELLLGAAKHGLGRTDITILNDPDFSFHKILGKNIFNSIPTCSKLFNKTEKPVKIECKDDILKFDKDEILVKLEKGEGTLKIEKVGIKKDKEPAFIDRKFEENSDKSQVELTIVKSESKSEQNQSSLTITTVMANKTEIKIPEINTIGTIDKTIAVDDDDNKLSLDKKSNESVDKIEEKVDTDIEKISNEKDNKDNDDYHIKENKNNIQNTEEGETMVKLVDNKKVECEMDKNNSTEGDDRKILENSNTDKIKMTDNVEKNVDMKIISTSPDESEIVHSINEDIVQDAKNIENEETNELDEENKQKTMEKTNEALTEKIDIKADVETVASTVNDEKLSITETKISSPSSVTMKAEDTGEKKEQSEIIYDEKITIEKQTSKTSQIDDKCSVQAAELKAMFPDLEVIQPLSRLTQIDTFVLRDKTEYPETSVAQLFSHNFPASIKWPKEHAIEARLMHIVHAVEHKEWPVAINFTAGDELEISNERDNSEVITITTDHGISRALAATNNLVASKKRKRHIAIDVETERAKLHALLNSSHMSSQPPSGLSKPSVLNTSWDINDNNNTSEESRRLNSLQPPPAHQHVRTPNVPFDLKYTVPGKTTIIPGTSSTLTPIDLSAGFHKSTTESNKDIMSEVQDFSMPSKNKQSSSNKGKLDSMLDKLMKRKNCPVEESPIGKEKKRRKLDEIVLGLSAAKEQQGNSGLFTEHNKKSTITPNVTVTPTSAPMGLSNFSPSTQKPFSITVTSIPSSRNSGSTTALPPPPPSLHSHKDSFSALLAQAEQQNRDLKKQQLQQSQSQSTQQQPAHHHQQQQLQHQQQSFTSAQLSSPASSSNSHRKSYEAMIADINKVAEYSSKIGSYSHETKVNKWLAEQTAMSEQLGAEYLNAPRRRRPRVDPSLLDWKKLTGEENVAVINRLTGKKVTGSKAPQLKRLGQWLMENPMFDVDPKWAELVKERGNLPHDLQKRLSGSERGNNSSSSSSKGKSPGRPPMMPSPTSQASSTPSNLTATSMASQLNFPGLSNSLLSTLSLGNFDPKSNPLLMPFGGLPNLGALGGLGNLGNLGNMNLTNSLFANLAGLGLPSLAGMEAALNASTVNSSTETNSANKNTGSTSSSTSSSSSATKSARGKIDTPTSKTSAPSTSSASSTSTLPTTTPFPFFFPNPSLLYTPLGLGGLNPFSMQPGGVSAYESLAQCGLLNPPTSSASSTRKSTISSSNTSSRQRDISNESYKRKDAEKKSTSSSSSSSVLATPLKYPLDSTLTTLQQYTSELMHVEDKKRDSERKEAIEVGDITDLSSKIERKNKEMKEALEQLSRTSAELLTRNMDELQKSQKRSRPSDISTSDQSIPSTLEVTLEPVNKKNKIDGEASLFKSVSTNESNVDETIVRQLSMNSTAKSQTPLSTPTSTPQPTPTTTPTSTPTPTPAITPTSTPTSISICPQLSLTQSAEESNQSNILLNISNNSSKEFVDLAPTDDSLHTATKEDHSANKSSSLESEEDGKNIKVGGKKSRGGKKMIEPPLERKNLRSSAGRQARAAAERQARMEEELHAAAASAAAEQENQPVSE